MDKRIHIVGQGLAGTVLAWRCLQAKVPFTIHEESRAFTASKVAAGLVTPVTGQRLARTAGWEWHPAMLRFYHWVQDQLGQTFYEPYPMLRILATADEQQLVQKRLADPGYTALLREEAADENPILRAPFGTIAMPDAGVLRVPEFLSASRRHFESLGCWSEVHQPCGDQTVLCQGPWLFDQALFDWLPMRYSHGDILTLRVPELDALPGARQRFYARHCWLLPDAKAHLWRVGATYQAVGTPTTEPLPEGREQLEAQLKDWLACDYKIVDHVAAVRPVTFTRNPLLGRHPANPRLAVFGGLGSKGVLTAPHYAQVLLDYLLDGTELPSEVDIAIH